MKDWNDAYKAGVNIRAMADKVNAYRSDNVVPLHGTPQTGPQLLTRCAADIEPEPIDWIWDGRIARGKLTVIGGDPEEGKSQLDEAKGAGLSWATVRRAKDALNLKSERDGYGGPWLWKRS